MTELQYLFNQQIKRIMRLETRIIKRGFTLSKSLVPKMPKRVTEQSIKRVASITAKEVLKGATIKENGDIIPALKSAIGQEYIRHSRPKQLFYDYDYVKKIRYLKEKTKEKKARKTRKDKGIKRGKLSEEEKQIRNEKRRKTMSARKYENQIRKTRKDKGVKRGKRNIKKSQEITQNVNFLPNEEPVIIDIIKEKQDVDFSKYNDFKKYMEEHQGITPDYITEMQLYKFTYVDNINILMHYGMDKAVEDFTPDDINYIEMARCFNAWEDILDTYSIDEIYDKVNGLPNEIKMQIDIIINPSSSDQEVQNASSTLLYYLGV